MSHTDLYGIFGNPVGHSLSPVMHNAAFKSMKMDAVYVPFRIDDPAGAVRAIRALGMRGASVTIPFKTDVLPLLDEVEESARAIGAVNTIVNDAGRLTGFNTDWSGLVRSLEDSLAIGGRTFAVLGAGGTARAAVFGILQRGGTPVVLNRSEEKGRRLAREFGCMFFPLTEIAEVEADCLINTTPVGMAPRENEMPVDRKAVGRFRWVMDVIYRPPRTRLLKEAEEAGAGILRGLEMFVHQGAEQFRIWTGMEAPVALMRQVVLEQLADERMRS